MRMKPIFLCVIFIISTSSSLFSFQQEQTVEERIKAVEEGLSDRMKHYDVPGVSIAVINNHQIEWAKGYGVEKIT